MCAIRGNISLSLVRWHHYIATSWNICFLGFKTSLVKVRKTATNTLFLIHFSGITFLSHSVKLFWKDKTFSNYTCYKCYVLVNSFKKGFTQLVGNNSRGNGKNFQWQTIFLSANVKIAIIDFLLNVIFKKSRGAMQFVRRRIMILDSIFLTLIRPLPYLILNGLWNFRQNK